MNMDAEQDLRERLGHALGAVSISPAPVGDAMRRGSAIRQRRQITAVGALAALAAVAVAIPVALHAHPPHSSPVSRGRHRGTVNSHAPARLIAGGTLDGRRWTVRVTAPGTGGTGRHGQCVLVGPGAGNEDCGPAMPSHGFGPAALTVFPLASKTAFTHGATAVYAPVATDVVYLSVRLAGGTVLTLHPVAAYGTRYAAFVADESTVIGVTAYSHHGELGTAIPFRSGGMLYFGNWLRPGERMGLPRVTRVIGSGRIAGLIWSVTVHQGPWGRCLLSALSAVDSRSYCLPGASPMGTALAGASGSVDLVYGTVPADAARIVVTLSDGTSARVRAVRAGNQKYFAFTHGTNVRAVRWATYSRSGHVIATGRVTGAF